MTRTEWSSELALPISEERDHIEGPADAPVTLVEYGDYECPYCGAAYPIVKEVQPRMGEKLRFVFRNFPITTSHPHAEHAAEAAEAAAAQGRFWEMHDYLYEHQRGLTDKDLHQYADELGLDVDKVRQRTRGTRARAACARGLHERRPERCEWDADLLCQRQKARRLVRRRDVAGRARASEGVGAMLPVSGCFGTKRRQWRQFEIRL
jgi:Thioredoxin